MNELQSYPQDGDYKRAHSLFEEIEIIRSVMAILMKRANTGSYRLKEAVVKSWVDEKSLHGSRSSLDLGG